MRALILLLVPALCLSACHHEPKPRGQVEAKTSDELGERLLIIEQVKRAFSARDFAKLNAMAREFRTRRSRTPSGTWKLSWFYRGMSIATEQKEGACSKEAFPVFEDWKKADPSQPTPYIAQAAILTNYAFCVRGGRLGHEVPDEAWPVFYEHIAAARQVLEANEKVASVDPQYYAEMIGISTAEGSWGWSLKSLLDEAVAKEPYYYDIYFRAVRYYLPQWNGDRGDIHWLGNYAVDQTEQGEGKAAYARVMWTLDEVKGADLTEMDWPTAKLAMEDVLRTFPDNWNAVNFARISCRMNDSEAAARFFERVSSDDGRAWGSDAASIAEWKRCRGIAGEPVGANGKVQRKGKRIPERCTFAIVEAWPNEDFEKLCRPRMR